MDFQQRTKFQYFFISTHQEADIYDECRFLTDEQRGSGYKIQSGKQTGAGGFLMGCGWKDGAVVHGGTSSLMFPGPEFS